MTKVAIMCRVSSDEQAKGYSLDAQYEALTRYCERMEYEIVYTIREDHSAKSFDRPEWKKWIKYAEQNYKEIDFLLVTAWDRFTRNADEGSQIINRHEERWNIKIQAIEQPIDYNIPEQRKLILSIYLSLPEVDNIRRSMKIKGGIRQALKQGRWPAKAIFGYKTERDSHGKSGLVPDPKTAPIVQYIFEQVAQGVSQIELCKEIAKTKGVKIARTGMSRIVRRALYIGKIIVPAEKNEPAQIVQGLHEPLISESLFYQVQQQLQGNRKARGKFIPKYAKIRKDFPLRGILKCHKCDGIMTASFSKGKLGKRYGYYHCDHCKQQRVSNGVTESAFNEHLAKISIGSETKELYNLILAEMIGGSQTENKNEAKNLRKQLDQLNQRIVECQDLMMDRKLDPDEYVQIKGRYSVRKDEIVDKLKNLKADKRDFASLSQAGLNLLENLSHAFENATVRLKHKIVGSIFPDLISFDGKKFRTPKLNPVFELFTNIDEGLQGKKKGDNSEFSELSPSAEKEGFEPTLSVALPLSYLSFEQRRIRTFDTQVTSNKIQISI